MEIPELTLRTLTGDDALAYETLLSRAFLHDPHTEAHQQLLRARVEDCLGHGVFDGDRLVGGGAIINNRSITLPGGDVVPFAPVTAVSVASDYRRRGVLTRIMREQLHGLHERSAQPFAILWASESRIYRRFGYGEASQAAGFSLAKGDEFRPGVEFSSDPIREMSAEQARPPIEEIHAKALPNRAGRLSRPTLEWDQFFLDQPQDRDGMTALRFAVHPEGYAVYRVKAGRGATGQLAVVEVISTTPQAHASLWRYLLDMDLVRDVTGVIGSDDPLRQMLAEPKTGLWKHSPGYWVRIVDIDRALPVRRYSTPVDLVFEVTDEFCPWNAGRWRLRVDGNGAAEVTSTDDAPDIAADILDLGAAFLGGVRLSTLALTGRVRELTGGAVARATIAFLGEHEPETYEVF